MSQPEPTYAEWSSIRYFARVRGVPVTIVHERNGRWTVTIRDSGITISHISPSLQQALDTVALKCRVDIIDDIRNIKIAGE